MIELLGSWEDFGALSSKPTKHQPQTGGVDWRGVAVIKSKPRHLPVKTESINDIVGIIDGTEFLMIVVGNHQVIVPSPAVRPITDPFCICR